MKGCALTIKGR